MPPGSLENLTTLRAHLDARKAAARAEDGHECGDLVAVIDSLSLACKWIGHKIQSARIEDVLGDAGAVNLHGETQQKLDVLSDQVLLECLGARNEVAIYASEEREEPVELSGDGRYCVLVDPLDGSSNVDVAVSVGTIFSIVKRPEGVRGTAALLQPGSRQVAAGYVLYGSSICMVLTLGDGVDLFVLDPDLGEFVLVQERMRIPERKAVYSINEAYWNEFGDEVRAYLSWAHEEGYGSRYIGSMVADVHRTLLKGGVFLYPATRKAPEGKLRLLYECYPMSMLIEQAGGSAGTGRERILDLTPRELHQRAPVVLGSPAEVAAVMRHFG